MYPKKTCAILRHPTLREGQTAFARGFLKVLKIIYGDDLYVVDTTKRKILSKNLFYVFEYMTTASIPCEVLHVLNLNKPLVSTLGLLGLKKLVTYQFSYLPKIHSNWRIKRALIERGSRLVVGTSRRIAELFGNGFFTYPPVDVELFKPRDRRAVRHLLKLPVDKVIIGYVGDVDINRGFDVVARLAAELGGNDVKFLFTYLRIDTLTREILSDIKRALRKNALIIRRSAPIWYVYNAVDVLLLPMRNSYPTEPPATLVEALASGTPVMGGASPSMRDYGRLYINLSDNDAYIDIVSNIATNKDTLYELSKRCRRFAVKNLSYQVVSQRLDEVLSKWAS